MLLSRHLTLMIIMLGLIGCGASKFDRGTSGAGIGAAAGAAVGAVTGLSVVQGALIGAAGGAITGLATSANQVNLGKPLWRKGSGSGNDPYSSGSPTVRNIQAALARLGYAPGPADGVAGPQTRSAIRAYQREHGLAVTGSPSESLYNHIQQRGG